MTERTIGDINQRINQKAESLIPSDRKAARGTGEGFWSKEQRAQRREMHASNWMDRVINNGFQSIGKFPYEPSRLHQRRGFEGTTPVAEKTTIQENVVFDATPAAAPQQ